MVYKTLHSEQFEDTKGITRSSKSKKDGQHNDQKKKDKRHKQRSIKMEQHETH